MRSSICIYALIDPESGQVRYVGQTNSPALRELEHLRSARPDGTRKERWLWNLQRHGQQPLFWIIEWCDPLLANRRERHWIEHYRQFFSEPFGVKHLTNARVYVPYQRHRVRRAWWVRLLFGE